MIFIVELILGFFLAMVVVGIIAAILGTENDAWAFSLSLVLLFFGAIWATGSWIYPMGPPIFGVYWLPFFLVSVFFLFFVLALPPINRPRQVVLSEETKEEVKRSERRSWTALTWIFIFLVAGLIWAATLYRPVIAMGG